VSQVLRFVTRGLAVENGRNKIERYEICERTPTHKRAVLFFGNMTSCRPGEVGIKAHSTNNSASVIRQYISARNIVLHPALSNKPIRHETETTKRNTRAYATQPRTPLRKKKDSYINVVSLIQKIESEGGHCVGNSTRSRLSRD